LLTLEQPSGPPNIQSLTFFDAVDHFSGGWAYETNYFKAKSDYVVNGLSDSGIQALVEALKGARRPDRGALRCIWRGDLKRTEQRVGLPAPRSADFLHSIFFQLDQVG
jgi:hypothetical protein